MCSDCEVYGLQKPGLTRSDCVALYHKSCHSSWSHPGCEQPHLGRGGGEIRL